MTLTGILAIVVIILFVVFLKLVIDCIRAKKWLRLIVVFAMFAAVLLLLSFGLNSFITSM